MAPNDNEPTRERLIAAARELFLARGFAATSTRAIAAQAGCNLSLIKYYFGSKEGLLREMLRVQYAAIEADVRELAAHDGPPAERLAAIIAAIAGRIDQNRELLRMMIRELATEDSPVAVEVAGLVRMVQNPIIALLEDARRQGQIRDVDPRFAGISLVGMLAFYHLAYPVTSILVGRRDPATIATLRDVVTRVFLHGVLLPPAPAKETAP